MLADDQHLVLVGMMAVGKTTVARKAAEKLGRVLFDTDAMIEQRAGRSVRDIFADDGEAVFRALEAEMLSIALASESPAVIAAAGGAVLNSDNRAALKGSNAHVVWLCADTDTLLERIHSAGHRPLLDDDPVGTLQRMFCEREAMYREVANAVVDVNQRCVDEVVEAVLA